MCVFASYTGVQQEFRSFSGLTFGFWDRKNIVAERGQTKGIFVLQGR